MTEKTARIVWLAPPEGGRKSPPTGPRYASPARFETPKGSVDSWSVVVEMFACFSDPMEWIATVRFLAPEAPAELLSDGARFELMEGKKRVAIGTIGSAVVPVGSSLNATAAQEVGR